MKGTEELQREHRAIEVMLRVINAMATKLMNDEPVGMDNLEGMLEFLAVFIDQCHHGKEEEYLFPALEAAGVPRKEGPIEVLLSEHAKGRIFAARLREAVDNLKAGNKSAVKDFQEAAGDYVDLLVLHIEKEDKVLFAMAEARLDAAEDNRIADGFQRLERDRVGPGKHEKLHDLLHRLENRFLLRAGL